MTKKENNAQVAFILAIIAISVLCMLAIFPSFFSNYGDTITRLTMLFVLYPSPLVLGIVALALIRDCAGGVNGKYRAYYIIARVFSILSVIFGSIAVTVYFFTNVISYIF